MLHGILLLVTAATVSWLVVGMIILKLLHMFVFSFHLLNGQRFIGFGFIKSLVLLILWPIASLLYILTYRGVYNLRSGKRRLYGNEVRN